MTTHAVLCVLIASAVTILLRFLPFLLFRGNRETPAYLLFLGKVLPYAVMGMLVVFALKNISFLVRPFALPELISVIVVVLLHLWKRNTLISIICGTACYMLLVQFVFI